MTVVWRYITDRSAEDTDQGKGWEEREGGFHVHKKRIIYFPSLHTWSSGVSLCGVFLTQGTEACWNLTLRDIIKASGVSPWLKMSLSIFSNTHHGTRIHSRCQDHGNEGGKKTVLCQDTNYSHTEILQNKQTKIMLIILESKYCSKWHQDKRVSHLRGSSHQ